MEKPPVLDHDVAGHHRVVHGVFDPHRGRQRCHILQAAGQLQPPGIHQEEVPRLAHGNLPQVIPPQDGGAAPGGQAQEVCAGGRRAAILEAVEKIPHPQLFQKVRAVVAGRAVHGKPHRHAQLQHSGNLGNAGGELHVADGTVGNAGFGGCEYLELVVVEVNAVGIPDVRAHPAQLFHIGKGTNAAGLQKIPLLILGLGQMGVEPHPQLTR